MGDDNYWIFSENRPARYLSTMCVRDNLPRFIAFWSPKKENWTVDFTRFYRNIPNFSWPTCWPLAFHGGLTVAWPATDRHECRRSRSRDWAHRFWSEIRGWAKRGRGELRFFVGKFSMKIPLNSRDWLLDIHGKSWLEQKDITDKNGFVVRREHLQFKLLKN